MIQNFKHFLTLAFLLSCGSAFSQQKRIFTVKQAVEHAVKNSFDIKNAMLDIEVQRQSNNEITSVAMPQLNMSVNATRFIDIPTTVLPDFISPSVYGVLVNEGVANSSGNPIQFPQGGFGSVPARFGTNWNASGGVDVSQILFDGQVFIGLKARKSALDLYRQSAMVTQEQIKANVYKMYYQLIVGTKQATTIDANIERLEKLYNDIKEIYKNGLVEKLDMEKVEVQLNNLKTEKEKINNQLETGNAALKFLIQVPQKDTLLLADTLNEVMIQELLSDTLDVNNRPEYKQLKTALKLSEYNIKRYQLSKLPTIVAFGSYSKNALRNEFDFFDSKGLWFNTSLVGLKVSYSLFDGFARQSRVRKATIESEKLKNNMEKLKEGIELESNSAKLQMESAMKTMNTQRKNNQLAEKVYEQTRLKYEQGLGSNTEIYNAQAELKTAQNNYYGALYDVIISRINYLKAIGKLY
jgi:outer membrane protein TolC